MQNRQFLSDCVTKQRAKHADVEASAVARANDSSFPQLVCDTQPRGERLVGGINIEVFVDISNSTDKQLPGFEVKQTSISVLLHSLGEDQLPAQTVVHRELLGCTPGILAVEEPSPLTFSRRCSSTHITIKGAHVAQQERRDSQSFVSDGSIRVEIRGAA